MRKQLIRNQSLQSVKILSLTPASRSDWVIILKRSHISLIGSRASKCENNLKEIVACESFVSFEFDVLPLLQGQVGSSLYICLIIG